MPQKNYPKYKKRKNKALSSVFTKGEKGFLKDTYAIIDDDSTNPDPDLKLTKKEKDKFKKLVREVVRGER